MVLVVAVKLMLSVVILKLVGVEMGEHSEDIHHYRHPDRAIYLLGNEQSGLPPKVLDACHDLIKLPGAYSLNVAVAGSVIIARSGYSGDTINTEEIAGRVGDTVN